MGRGLHRQVEGQGIGPVLPRHQHGTDVGNGAEAVGIGAVGAPQGVSRHGGAAVLAVLDHSGVDSRDLHTEDHLAGLPGRRVHFTDGAVSENTADHKADHHRQQNEIHHQGDPSAVAGTLEPHLTAPLAFLPLGGGGAMNCGTVRQAGGLGVAAMTFERSHMLTPLL